MLFGFRAPGFSLQGTHPNSGPYGWSTSLKYNHHWEADLRMSGVIVRLKVDANHCAKKSALSQHHPKVPCKKFNVHVKI